MLVALGDFGGTPHSVLQHRREMQGRSMGAGLCCGQLGWSNARLEAEVQVRKLGEELRLEKDL